MPTISTQPISQELTNNEPRVIEKTADLNPPSPSDPPPEIDAVSTGESSLTPIGEQPLSVLTPEAPAAGAEGGGAQPEGGEKMEAAGEQIPRAMGEAPATETTEGLRVRSRQPKKQKMAAIPQVQDTVTRQVEQILEAGLGDAFQALTPIQKQEFKIKGEETARKIRDLLRDAHMKVKKIFRLILQWLKILPGLNRFFLEQEAKIKADKIIALKHMTPDS